MVDEDGRAERPDGAPAPVAGGQPEEPPPAPPPDPAPAPSPAPPPEDPDVAKHRMSLGRDIVALAIVAAVGVAALSIVVYTTAQEAAAVIGLFTTLVGTLGGMIFGASIGQKSASQALAQANQAQVASLFVDPAKAEEVVKNSTVNGNPTEADF